MPCAACPGRSARPRPRRSRSSPAGRGSSWRRRASSSPGRTATRASHHGRPAAAASHRPPRPRRRIRSGRLGARRAAAGRRRARPRSATGRRRSARSAPRAGRAGPRQSGGPSTVSGSATPPPTAAVAPSPVTTGWYAPIPAAASAHTARSPSGAGPLGDLAGQGERRRVGVVLGRIVLAPDRAPGIERDPGRLELGGQLVGRRLDPERRGAPRGRSTRRTPRSPSGRSRRPPLNQAWADSWRTTKSPAS